MSLANARKLFRVRLVHMIIHVINGGACFVILHAGVTGETG